MPILHSEITLSALLHKLGDGYSVEGKKVILHNKSIPNLSYEHSGNRHKVFEKDTKSGFDIEAAKSERNRLMISKDNPQRLKELQSRIDYLEYGIS